MIRKMMRTSGIFIFSVLLFAQNGFSLSVMKPSFASNDYLKASVFVKMSAKEFAGASGTKLNLIEKVYLKVLQHKIKKELKKNPDFLLTNYIDKKTGKFKFDALWFVIGLFIGPLAILLAYFSHKQKNGPTKKDRIISAWIGFAAFILWFGLLFLF
jgi:hypothetical protein